MTGSAKQYQDLAKRRGAEMSDNVANVLATLQGHHKALLDFYITPSNNASDSQQDSYVLTVRHPNSNAVSWIYDTDGRYQANLAFIDEPTSCIERKIPQPADLSLNAYNGKLSKVWKSVHFETLLAAINTLKSKQSTDKALHGETLHIETFQGFPSRNCVIFRGDRPMLTFIPIKDDTISLLPDLLPSAQAELSALLSPLSRRQTQEAETGSELPAWFSAHLNNFDKGRRAHRVNLWKNNTRQPPPSRELQ